MTRVLCIAVACAVIIGLAAGYWAASAYTCGPNRIRLEAGICPSASSDTLGIQDSMEDFE